MHRQPPRIAPSFRRVRAHHAPRDFSLSLFFFQQELQLNNANGFSGPLRVFRQFCRRAKVLVAVQDHRCRSIILLQSSELCYTARSLRGIFVCSSFYFFFELHSVVRHKSKPLRITFFLKKIKSMEKYKELETRQAFF